VTRHPGIIIGRPVLKAAAAHLISNPLCRDDPSIRGILVNLRSGDGEVSPHSDHTAWVVYLQDLIAPEEKPSHIPIYNMLVDMFIRNYVHPILQCRHQAVVGHLYSGASKIGDHK
jgi:hypothetical protein